MHKISALLIAAMLVGSMSMYAQTERKCGSMEVLEQQLAADPDMANRMEAIERHTEQYMESGNHEHDRVVVTIPVVFHIIHNGDAVGTNENISDALIQAQLNQLNLDFRKLNSDASLIPSVFAGVAADAEVQFCLAQRTPSGAATTGINRLNQGQASWTMNQIESSLKPSTIWDRNKYLNLWTVIFGGGDAGTLGYAQFPGGSASTDGVVLLYSSVGSVASPNPAGGAYGKGRTATHEVGHWLNLRHIWGDATCGNDQVSDTPTHNTANYGCPAYPHYSTCTGSPVEMTMNYMDYTDDACMYMFTTGQKGRMQALFAAGGSRAGLATSDGCTAPGGGGGGTTCAIPSGLNATAITQTSATLNWGAVSGAGSYNVRARQVGTTTWSTGTATTTSSNFTGLTCNTSYEFQVEAVCSGGTSGFSASATFTTSSCTTPTCTDTFEANNSKSAAKNIPLNTLSTALISTSTDVDWYKFTLTSTQKNIRVTMSNLPFDYDFKLYRNNTLLATAQNGGTTNEVVIRNNTSTGTSNVYYIQVYGYNGAFSATQCYNLLVETSATAFRTGAETASAMELEPASFDVYPNPVTGIANIHLTPGANDEMVTISVYDVTGRMVMSQSRLNSKETSDVVLDMSQLSNGMYIIRLESSEAVLSRKVMLSK